MSGQLPPSLNSIAVAGLPAYIGAMDHKDWEILEREMIHDGGWLKLRRERCRTNTGQIIDPYFILDFDGWVLTIPVTVEGNLLLLEHYRHGLRRISWEFPSGLGEPGEDPIDGAKRELLEETGYAGDNLKLLGKLAPNPAIQSNWLSVVLITGAKPVAEPAPEPGEELKVHFRTVDEVAQMVSDGRMYHALNVAAFSLARAHGAFRDRT